MNARGAALILVLAVQPMLSLLAVEVTQHVRLQQRVLGRDWARTSALYDAQATLMEVAARVRASPQSVVKHRHPALMIKPHDCSLRGWLNTSPDWAPWVAWPTQRRDAFDYLVIEGSGSGCRHRLSEAASYHVVVRIRSPNRPAWYLLMLVSGEPLMPTHWRMHH